MVALSLHRACLDAGWTSRLVIGRRSGPRERDVITLDELGRPSLRERWRRSVDARSDALDAAARPRLARIARALASPRRLLDRRLGLERFDFPASWRLLEALPDGPPDLVQVHNLHGDYFDLRSVAPLSRQVPVVLTLHDGWLMSGHCAHSFDCERWRTGCGRCPHLETYPAVRRDATRLNWWRKRQALARARLHVAAPSRWLLDRVRGSLLADAVVELRLLENGVDLDVFSPGHREQARRDLGVEVDERVLLFVGNEPRANRFKDFPTLLSAAARLEGTSRLVVMALGEDAPPERAGAAVVRYRRERDPSRMALWYRAADVYVHATRADTFPTSVLEAMACGRPIVASAVGGVTEQVEHGRTALLVVPGDPHALARALADLLAAPALAARLGSAAAEEARRRFDARARRNDYLDWYRSLAREHRRG